MQTTKTRLTPILLAIGLLSAQAAPPETTLIRGSDGLLEISWPAPTDGNDYLLKASAVLTSTGWDDLPTSATIAGGIHRQKLPTPSTDPDSEVPARQFFRLEQDDTPTSSGFPKLPGTHRVLIDEDPDPETGEARSRLLYVFIPDGYAPPARDAQGRWPCPGGYDAAIILHGSGQTAQDFKNLHPDLITECNAKGIILIIPQGELNPVNGNYGWNGAEQPGQRNDLRFLVLLRGLALAALYIDPDRVHIGGFSNGGVMSMVASHSLPRLFASTAAIGSSVDSASTTMNVSSTVPVPIAPLPMLFVNAKNDTKRPFLGGLAANGLTTQASFAEGQTFLRTNHCPAGGLITTTTKFPGGALAYTTETWCEPGLNYVCPSGYEVQTVALEGGGHIWPDAADGTQYDANVEVTDFFLRHHIQPVDDYGNFVAIPADAGGSRNPMPGSGIDVAAGIHASPPRALAFLFHGPGANHDNFVDATEMTALTQNLFADNVAWISYSADHASTLWDLEHGPAGNNDILNLLRIRQELINLGRITASTPIIPIGFDRGAHFALLAAHLIHSMGLPVGGCGMLCPDFSTPLPPAAQNAKANTLVPVWTFAQENDQVANATLAWNYHETLRYRSQDMREFSLMDLGREKCANADRFDRILPAVDGDAILDHLEAEGLIDSSHHRTFCKRDLGSTLANLNPPTHLGYTADQLAEVFFQIQVMFSAHHPETDGNRLLSYVDCMLGTPGKGGWTDRDVPPTTSIDVPNLGGD